MQVLITRATAFTLDRVNPAKGRRCMPVKTGGVAFPVLPLPPPFVGIMLQKVNAVPLPEN